MSLFDVDLESLKGAVQKRYRGARLIQGFVQGRPIHCIIQISNLCNLSCSFCSFWENPAKKSHEMTLDDVKVISARLAEGGSMLVSIEGGEPLLRPDILDIIAAFRKYHHPIMFTNGWRVDHQVANDLWNAGLDTVGVSVDYPDAERHDAHRGKKGTFEAALRAAEILRDTAPLGARQVFLMSVLMKDNARDMEKLLQISERLGVGHQITLLTTDGDGRHVGEKDRPFDGIGAKLLELKAKYPHFIAFSGYLEAIDPFLNGHVRTPCYAGERFLNIDHMGDVSPCIEKLDWRVGNLIREPWDVVYDRLVHLEKVKTCTDCLTSCRGFVEEMSGVPNLRSYREFFSDFAKTSPAAIR